MELLLSAFIGFILVTILDKRWFDIDHKKIEKGYEVIEHYHFGVGLIGIGIFTFVFSSILSYVLLGAGMGLIYHEAKQKNYFAHKSTHFRNSSIIRIILTVITTILFFYLYYN